MLNAQPSPSSAQRTASLLTFLRFSLSLDSIQFEAQRVGEYLLARPAARIA
jgi:hypothetical protein